MTRDPAPAVMFLLFLGALVVLALRWLAGILF